MTTTPDPALPRSSRTVIEPGLDAEVLDRGTFAPVGAPRRGWLTGTDAADPAPWHRLARPYLRTELIELALWTVAVMGASVLLGIWTGAWWPYPVGGVLVVVLLVWAAILPRRLRSWGYRLRADDIVVRRGILLQRELAVPYGRLQLVDIAHGPLDRAFSIAQVKLVSAASTGSVVLPGLRQEAAELLRDALIELAEQRRTPL